jgi:hypothetical protein
MVGFNKMLLRLEMGTMERRRWHDGGGGERRATTNERTDKDDEHRKSWPQTFAGEQRPI